MLLIKREDLVIYNLVRKENHVHKNNMIGYKVLIGWIALHGHVIR
jgi:hypothetical protein